MRLAGWVKIGFYPTPDVVVEMVSRRITPPVSGLWRLLDPCAGEGEAASKCAALVGGTAETLGVELSYSRAAKAAQRLTKVVFAVYRDTLEEQAMRLMGQKMRAAQLLYGDEVGGAIVPESGADSFLTELARSVLEEAELPDLKALFGATAKVEVATVQAPQEQEAEVRPSLAELRRRMAEAEAQMRRRRKKRSVPAGQLPLFSFA